MVSSSSGQAPALQLVIDNIACVALRNRDAEKTGKSRAEKADAKASDPFVRARLIEPATLLKRKEVELARAETPHIADNANPAWPSARLVLPIPPKGLKIDGKKGTYTIVASVVLEVFDLENADSPKALGRLSAAKMAKLFIPLTLDARSTSTTVTVPTTLLEGSSAEVDKNASAISFAFRLEPRSEADTKRAMALAPAAAADASEVAKPPAKPPPPALPAVGAGPSAAAGRSAAAGSPAAAAAAPAVETPRNRASRRAARPAEAEPEAQPPAVAPAPPAPPAAQDESAAATQIQSRARGRAARRDAAAARAQEVEATEAAAATAVPPLAAAPRASIQPASATTVPAPTPALSAQSAAPQAAQPAAPQAGALAAAPPVSRAAVEAAAATTIQSRSRALRSREQVSALQVRQQGDFARAAALAEAEETKAAHADAALMIQARARAKTASEAVAQKRLAASMAAAAAADESASEYADSDAGGDDARARAACTIQKTRRGAVAREQLARAEMLDRHGTQFALADDDSMSEASFASSTPLVTPRGSTSLPRAPAPSPAPSGSAARPVAQVPSSARQSMMESLRQEAADEATAAAAAAGPRAGARDAERARGRGAAAESAAAGAAAAAADDGVEELVPTSVVDRSEARAAATVQARARGNAERAALELRPSGGAAQAGGALPTESAADKAARVAAAAVEAERARLDGAAGTVQRAERARAAERVARRQAADAEAARAAAASRVQAAQRGKAARATTGATLADARAAKARAAEAEQRSAAARTIAASYKARALSQDARKTRDELATDKRAREAADARARADADAKAAAAARAGAAREAATRDAAARLRRDAAARFIQRAARRWLGARRVSAATRIQNRYRGQRARAESVGLRSLFASAAEGELLRAVSELSAAAFAEVVEAQVEAADASKRRASSLEDFESAARAKRHITAVDGLLDKLDALEARLADRVRAQDFAGALALKGNVDGARLRVCVELADYRGRPIGGAPAARQAATPRPPPTPLGATTPLPPLASARPPATLAATLGGAPSPPLGAAASEFRALGATSDLGLAALFAPGGGGGGLGALVAQAGAASAVEREADAALGSTAALAGAAAAPLGEPTSAAPTARAGGADGFGAASVGAHEAAHARLTLADLPLPVDTARRGAGDADSALRLVRAVFGEAAALYLASAKQPLRRAALEQAASDLSNAGKANAAVQRARGVSVLRAGSSMLELGLRDADAHTGAAGRALLLALLRAASLHADGQHVRLLPSLLAPPLLATLARGAAAPSADATRASGEALKTLFALCEAEHVGSARVATAIFDAHAAARAAASGAATPAEPRRESVALGALSALRQILARYGGFKSVADPRRPPTVGIVRFVAKVHTAAALDERAAALAAAADGDAARAAAAAVQAAAVQCALAARDVDGASVESILRSMPATALLHALSLSATLHPPRHGAPDDAAAARAGAGARSAGAAADADGKRAAAAAAARLRELKSAEASLAKTLVALRTAARREETRAAAAAKVGAPLAAVAAEAAGAHLKAPALEALRTALRKERARLDACVVRARTIEAQRRKVRPADLRTLARARELEQVHYLTADAELKEAAGAERRGEGKATAASHPPPLGADARAQLAAQVERLARERADAVAARADAQTRLLAASAEVRELEAAVRARAAGGGAPPPPRAAWSVGTDAAASPGAVDARLGALRDRAALRERQREYVEAEAAQLGARLRARLALKEARLRELGAQRARYAELLAAERAANLAGLRPAPAAARASATGSLGGWSGAEEADEQPDGGGGRRAPSLPRAPRTAEGAQGGGDGVAQPPGGAAANERPRTASEISAAPPEASAAPAQPSARTAARASRAEAEAAPAAPSAPPTGRPGRGGAAAPAAPAAAATAASAPAPSKATAATAAVAAPKAAAMAPPSAASLASGVQGDELSFAVHAFTLCAPAAAAAKKSFMPAFGKKPAAVPASKLVAGARVKFAVQSELAPPPSIKLTDAATLPKAGEELAVPSPLSMAIDTTHDSPGLGLLRKALQTGDDVEAEVTFIVVDASSAEQDELCYATLDLSKLKVDMTKQQVDAIDNVSNLKVGTFTISVQAVGAVHRARPRAERAGVTC